MTADLALKTTLPGTGSIFDAGLNVPADPIDKELVALVAPETPDYDTIFQLKYGADGRATAEKRSLNFVVMFGNEEDDLFYNGGIEMIKAQGFAKVDTDKPGYEMFVKKVNQNDPAKPCQEIRTYVAHMNGRNMMQAMSDPDIDLIQYDGHSNLGRNIRTASRTRPTWPAARSSRWEPAPPPIACSSSATASAIRSAFR